MKRPSEHALDFAEAILDHVSYGLTRADALYELAEMIDDYNTELLSAVGATLRDAERNGGFTSPDSLAQLRDALRGYQPLRTGLGDHPDLFIARPATLF